MFRIKIAIKTLILNILWRRVERQIEIQNPKIIAITGSVGKTSSKEAVKLMLEKAGRVVISPRGNLNTEIGVPLAIMGWQEQPSGAMDWLKVILKAKFGRIATSIKLARNDNMSIYYVLEFSADKPGDIKYLTDRIPIDIAILTMITPVHMANYRSMAELIREKTGIFSGLKRNGIVVTNQDDPNQKNIILSKDGVKRELARYYYGVKSARLSGPGVLVRPGAFTEEGWSATLINNIGLKENDQKNELALNTQVIGRHHLYALAVAGLVGKLEGLSPKQIKTGLEAYQTPPGRGRLIVGRRHTIVMDDSYNASPESMVASLQTLKETNLNKRKVAILGNMNELGDTATLEHEKLGAVAAKMVDYLIAIGVNSADILRGAKSAGMSDGNMINFRKTEDIIDRIDQLIRPFDFILVKGSQNGVRLERLVKVLMKNPKQAGDLLVRQGRKWR